MQHGGVCCWRISELAVNKKDFCMLYCTAVSDYTGQAINIQG